MGAVLITVGVLVAAVAYHCKRNREEHRARMVAARRHAVNEEMFNESIRRHQGPMPGQFILLSVNMCVVTTVRGEYACNLYVPLTCFFNCMY